LGDLRVAGLGYVTAKVGNRTVYSQNFGELFHGTEETSISDAFRFGLPAKGTAVDLIHHAEPQPRPSNIQSAFRGATRQRINQVKSAGAVLWSAVVFELRNVPGYDLSQHLFMSIPTPGGYRSGLFPAEEEIAIPAEIPSSNVYRALEYEVLRGGYSPKFSLNVNFTGNRL
jgi:hypothetical protein